MPFCDVWGICNKHCCLNSDSVREDVEIWCDWSESTSSAQQGVLTASCTSVSRFPLHVLKERKPRSQIWIFDGLHWRIWLRFYHLGHPIWLGTTDQCSSLLIGPSHHRPMFKSGCARLFFLFDFLCVSTNTCASLLSKESFAFIPFFTWFFEPTGDWRTSCQMYKQCTASSKNVNNQQ